MIGVEVAFRNGPIAPLDNRFGVVLRTAPEIAYVAIDVVQRFYPRRVWPREEERCTSAERFHHVIAIADAFPNQPGDLRFSTKSRGKGAFKRFRPTFRPLSFLRAEALG